MNPLATAAEITLTPPKPKTTRAAVARSDFPRRRQRPSSPRKTIGTPAIATAWIQIPMVA